MLARIDILSIDLNKTQEWYKNSKNDAELSMENLHLANRARHELEIRLHAELEAAYRLKQTVEEKVKIIGDYEIKMEYFD